ncbi:MAG: aspartate/glutamate racemase family protein [Gammaproteobacteria bacterium]|nr:aspartate/glutamate racemase family protein [Gammaproteobacteria bacterium]NNM11893.1 hypothetical protein [Pseudomonadales bacterium]RZV54607.1 MAG: hypothetical protein EX270_07365 [Pseudomonadales bacterium]
MLGIARLGEISTTWYQQRIQNYAPGLDYQMVDYDFSTLNAFLPDNYPALEPLLLKLLATAKQQGVSKLLLPNITLHHCFYLHPDWRCNVSLFDPFDMLNSALHGRQVYVLGTRHTQESPVLRERLHQQGIVLRSVDAATCASIDALRLDIFHNGFSVAAAKALSVVVAKLSEEAVVIIACSELSVALQQSGKNVLDLAMLQIKAFTAQGT